MSDTWSDIQAVKNRTSSLRAKMAARRKEREGLVAEITSASTGNAASKASSSGGTPVVETGNTSSDVSTSPTKASHSRPGSSTKESTAPAVSTNVTATSVKVTPRETEVVKFDPEIEKRVLLVLCDISLDIPCNAAVIADQTSRMMGRDVSLSLVEDLLRKFEAQQMISITVGETSAQDKSKLVVSTLDLSKLSAVTSDEKIQTKKRKRESETESQADPPSKQSKQTTSTKEDDSIESLLSMQSAKEKESKKLSDEIQDLLTKPTAKEQILVQRFKSQGGAQLKEFCQYGTKEECKKFTGTKVLCKKLHFRKIIHKHTDESLGDCSFLNTCFHMDTCKYVHYEIDYPAQTSTEMLKKEAILAKKATETSTSGDSQVCMYPPQWIQCDLRSFAMSTLGKCAVVMADPPWDIHMELPYGTMSDEEMRKLDVPGLQDDGFIFLWVTGRAMELGRECLELWGYKRVDELIWVKTNQLQRIIRTGRTGHWLNHGKEHCLVGVKGNPKGVNKGLDCDVIVAEVRATSHKPDEVYGIIERLSPGTRKVELFGRPHNVQPNWITLGNQLEGVRLKDPDIVKRFKAKYPDGNCMEAPKPRS